MRCRHGMRVLGRSVSGIGVVMYVSSPSDQTPLPNPASLRPSALRSTCWSIWRGSYLPRRRWMSSVWSERASSARPAGLDGGRVGIDVADGVVRVPRPVLQAVMRSPVRQRSSAPPHAIATAAFHPRAIPRPRGVEREPVIQRAASRSRQPREKPPARGRSERSRPGQRTSLGGSVHARSRRGVWWPAFTLLRMVELARKGALARLGRVAAAAITTPVRSVTQGVVGMLTTIERVTSSTP